MDRNSIHIFVYKIRYCRLPN